MARYSDGQSILLEAPQISSAAIEPIEKKPLYHYKPNLRTLSFGGYGCNMSCDFCQNWMVSQEKPSDLMDGYQLIGMAREHECDALCMTYNEPLIYFEFLDFLRQSWDHDLVIKTNAYCEADPWSEVCDWVDAMNIDWKGSEARYRAVAKTDGATTLRRIEEALAASVHVEISVPVYLDGEDDEYLDFADWLSGLDRSTPVHLLKLFPAFRNVSQPATPNKKISRIRDAMLERLDYVYAHNIFGEAGREMKRTICRSCGQKIADRTGLRTEFSVCGCGTIRT